MIQAINQDNKHKLFYDIFSYNIKLAESLKLVIVDKRKQHQILYLNL